MHLYRLQKTLVAARTEAARGAVQAAGNDPRGRVQTELDRLIGISGNLMRALESFNAPPTADQRRQTEWLFDDARRAIGEVNRSAQRQIPLP